LNNHNVAGVNETHCAKEVTMPKTKFTIPVHMPLGVEDANKMLLLVLIFEDVYRAVSDVRSLNWKYSLHKVAQQDELRHLLKTY